MARTFANTSSQYLIRTAAPITAAPLTMACWANATTLGNRDLMTLSSNSGTAYFEMSQLNSGAIRFYCNTDSCTTSTTVAEAANFHACVVAASSTDRRVFLNGGGKATSTASVTPAGIDRFSIGSFLSFGSYFNGSVWEAAIYNAALADSEVAELAAGFSPALVRPDALVGWWRLLDSDADADWWGQNDLTAVNTPTYSQHPPIIYPNGLLTVNQAAAGGGGGGALLPFLTNKRANRMALVGGRQI